jgi:hypothetical protein
MKRSELKQLIQEVIEESKLYQEGNTTIKKYKKPVKAGPVDIIGWKRDTNGNSVIVYEFIKNGKAKTKSTQLGGVMSSLSSNDYQDLEKGPSKKVITLVRDEVEDIK